MEKIMQKQSKSINLTIEAEYAKYFSHDLTVINDDRIHGIIFRLKSNMTFFFIESLYGFGIVNQRNYNLTISCRVATMN